MEDTNTHTLAAVPVDDHELPTLGRADVLGRIDLVVEKVPVPEWGGAVYVRGLTGTDRERYLDSLHVTVGKGRDARREIRATGASAKLCVLAICDKNGHRIFTDADVKALGEKSSAALERVSKVAARLNGLGDEEAEAEADAGNA